MRTNNREFIDILRKKSDILAKRIDVMKEEAKKWLRSLGKNDFRHSENIEGYLSSLVPDNIKEEFKAGEIFVLLYATYLHDIGYLCSKDNHERKSHDKIMRNPSHYLLSDEAYAVAIICFGHASENVCPIDGISDSRVFPELDRRPLRLQFIAALFRLADELDNAYNRISGCPDQSESERQLIMGINIDTERWKIICESMPYINGNDWNRIDMRRKRVQKRLDEVKKILQTGGLFYDRVDIDPYDENPFPDISQPVTLNALGGIITAESLLNSKPQLPSNFIIPSLLINEVDIDALFNCWSGIILERNKGKGLNIAIIARPGVGKTVLLWKFAEWLGKQGLKMRPNSLSVLPVVVFLNPDNMPTDLTQEGLWEHIQINVEKGISPYQYRKEQNLLEYFREKGLLYLLFDGLDQFGAGKYGDRDRLMKSLIELSENKKLNIFITCRKIFWEQMIRNKKPWQTIEIVSPSTEQMIDIIPTPEQQKFFYDDLGNPKPGLMNQLILSFIRELYSVHPYLKFSTRLDLFETWAAYAADDAKRRTGISSEDWSRFFKKSALWLLEKEKSYFLPREATHNNQITLEQCFVTEIYLPSSDGKKIKFAHHLVAEFFGARGLQESFSAVIENPTDYEALRKLPLSNVYLDFLPVSIYGFIYEKLGNEYIDKLTDALDKMDMGIWITDPLIKLIRNLIEYIGVTYHGDHSRHRLAKWLISVIGNNKLDLPADDYEKNRDHDMLRYNAARALERIHPWTPSPYFDYMSDWGDKSWKEERDRARKANLIPWKIQGYSSRSRRRRRPGQHPSLAVIKSQVYDHELQSHVSDALIKIIFQLLEEPIKNDWLLINCTHALTRWYCEEHSYRVNELRDFASRQGAAIYVISNLKDWVGHLGFM